MRTRVQKWNKHVFKKQHFLAADFLRNLSAIRNKGSYSSIATNLFIVGHWEETLEINCQSSGLQSKINERK